MQRAAVDEGLKCHSSQDACAAAFLSAIETGAPAPIAVGELFEVARVTIEATEILRAQT